MVYHASALENLTAICQKVQQFDDEAESKVKNEGFGLIYLGFLL